MENIIAFITFELRAPTAECLRMLSYKFLAVEPPIACLALIVQGNLRTVSYGMMHWGLTVTAGDSMESRGNKYHLTIIYSGSTVNVCITVTHEARI